MKIFVIGSGSWGSALAQICVDNGHDVLIYGNCADEINEINEYHTNSKYFPNVKLNENLKGTLNLEDVKVIATGGLSTLIASETNSIEYVDRFLTLDGLRILYEKNKE